MALFWYIDILDSICFWIMIVIILIILIKMMSFITGYASRRLLNILLGPTLYLFNFRTLFKIFFNVLIFWSTHFWRIGNNKELISQDSFWRQPANLLSPKGHCCTVIFFCPPIYNALQITLTFLPLMEWFEVTLNQY